LVFVTDPVTLCYVANKPLTLQQYSIVMMLCGTAFCNPLHSKHLCFTYHSFSHPSGNGLCFSTVFFIDSVS